MIILAGTYIQVHTVVTVVSGILFLDFDQAKCYDQSFSLDMRVVKKMRHITHKPIPKKKKITAIGKSE